MSELLFVRHAETDMSGTFCGHTNPLINDRGKDQIHHLLSTLQNKSIDAIYSSDLLRATHTAMAIADSFHLPVTTSNSLREIDFGEWDGLTWQDIEQRDSAFSKIWLEQYPNVPAPNGESFIDFQSRVLIKVAAIAKLSDHRCAAVITHAGVMRVVLQTLCNLDEATAWGRTKEYCSFFAYVPGIGLIEGRA